MFSPSESYLARWFSGGFLYLGASQMYIDEFVVLKPKNTQRAYRQAIADFAAKYEISSCSTIDAIKYISEYKIDRADATVKHRYHALRSYFEFLVNSDHLQKNPFRIIPSVLSLRQKHQVRPTKTLLVKDVAKILKSIKTEDPKKRLQHAFIAILFACGLRRSEALALAPKNIVLGVLRKDSYLILDRTKSGERETQPIPFWMVKILKKVLADRTKEGISIQQPIFPWSESTAYRIFKRVSREAGIDCAPHSFRAAAATVLKESGEEDRSVADFLRHKTTTMVSVYDHRHKKARAKTKRAIENFFKICEKSS